MSSTVPKIEVQYYPQPNCSGNLCRVGVFACPDGIRPVIFLLEAE